MSGTMKRTRRLVAFCVCAVGIASAQSAVPNATGVASVSSEFHLERPLLEFWQAVTGGSPGIIMTGQISFLTFQDLNFGVVNFSQKPTGGMAGSVIDHLGLRVKNLSEALARVQSAEFRAVQDTDPNRAFVHGPEGLNIELIGDAALASQVQWDHIHFRSQEPERMRAWYAATFGALADNRGPEPAADLPGMKLLFAKSESATAPTKGRVVDGIHIEIADIEKFRGELETQGTALEQEKRHDTPWPVAHLTDPWGTSIVLTQSRQR